MTEDQLIQNILKDLDESITNIEKKKAEAGTRDCIDECAKAYDSCMANAGSVLEQAACKAAYNKCISNC